MLRSPTAAIFTLMAFVAVIAVMAFGENRPRAFVHSDLKYFSPARPAPPPQECAPSNGCVLQADRPG
jgi:hypothetical protein